MHNMQILVPLLFIIMKIKKLRWKDPEKVRREVKLNYISYSSL